MSDEAALKFYQRCFQIYPFYYVLFLFLRVLCIHNRSYYGKLTQLEILRIKRMRDSIIQNVFSYRCLDSFSRSDLVVTELLTSEI